MLSNKGSYGYIPHQPEVLQSQIINFHNQFTRTDGDGHSSCHGSFE